ncbi:hypothetical protein [Yoonia sediminilitoris]|uniref:hypothetical protein n=1 Tax=Yoonia sediminilitoris TaxID=1286148 RepID=UPI001FEAB296|nr:hypothetical protein [Yoonia sediminilitoris]
MQAKIDMTENSRNRLAGSGNAADRVAEVTRLFESVRHRLDQMIQEIGATDESTPKSIVSKLNELQAAHLRLLVAEDAFYDQNRSDTEEETVDFRTIRAEIGRKLDRLRDTLATGGISGEADSN